MAGCSSSSSSSIISCYLLLRGGVVIRGQEGRSFGYCWRLKSVVMLEMKVVTMMVIELRATICMCLSL